MQPTIKQLDALKIVGVGGRFISALSPDHTNFPVIPQLWDSYQQRQSEITGRRSDATSLGVVTSVENPSRPDEFLYIAGTEVDTLDAVPEGMDAREIPPATYAMFTYRGPIQEIGQIYGYIYGEWLPTSDYQRAPGAEFELYDERFRHDSDASELDIYIPVAPKAG